MKTIKNIAKMLILGLYIGVGSVAAAQQEQPKPPPIPNEVQLAKMIDNLAKELNLNDAQKEKINALHVEHFEQVKILHSENDKQRGVTKEKHDKLRADFEAKIQTLLSKEQFEKFKKIKVTKHKRKGQGQRHPKK